MTQAAFKLFLDKFDAKEKNKIKLLYPKDQVLGHLANVPDIVWRNADKKIADENFPTHFIDLDHIHPKPSFNSIPIHIDEVKKILAEKKMELHPEVGSAPWRVAQFYSRMVSLGQEIIKLDTNAEKNQSQLNDVIYQWINHMGMMSHFVGDLGQPLHTSKEYDGWESNQGGLHKYFESDVVACHPLKINEEVYLTAKKTKPANVLFKGTPKSIVKNKNDEPLALTFALAFNSFGDVPTLLKLDKKVSLLKPSKDAPVKIEAERKSPCEVASGYYLFTVKRMAHSADVLADLWYRAWIESGKPDFNSYRSFKYPIMPEFISVDYL